MQATQNLWEIQIDVLIEAIYLRGNPIVKEAYSVFDQAPRLFATADEFRNSIDSMGRGKPPFHHFSVYYPECRGRVIEKRIELKPDACPGFTHRFAQNGWGLINVLLNAKNFPQIEVSISVNSRERALRWSDNYLDHGHPDLWDWTCVDRHAGRLIRLLRKMGKQAVLLKPRDE